MSFKYDELPSQPSLRLVHVLPAKGQNDSVIECHLKTVVENTRSYMALSYTWGSSMDMREISLNGKPFLVRENLFEFLDWYRSPDRLIASSQASMTHLGLPGLHWSTLAASGSIWIDAVCINQGDVREKNEQVRRMGNIYQNALAVIVWLGPASENSQQAMRFLASRHIGTYEDGFCVRELFNREYWKRIWIIQEFVRAKDLIIACGDEELDLRTYTRFCEYVEKGFYDVKHGFYDLRQGVPFMLMQLRKSPGRARLHELLIKFRDQTCIIPHDRIYALLDLCTEQRLLQIDYGKNIQELFCEVMENCKLEPEYLICFGQFLQRLLGLEDAPPPRFHLKPPSLANDHKEFSFVDAESWIRGRISYVGNSQVGTNRLHVNTCFEDYVAHLQSDIDDFYRKAHEPRNDNSPRAPPGYVHTVAKVCHTKFGSMNNSDNAKSRWSLPSTLRFVLWSDELSDTGKIASTALTHGHPQLGDEICQFDSIEAAVILRRKLDTYQIVGTAYLIDHQFEKRNVLKNDDFNVAIQSGRSTNKIMNGEMECFTSELLHFGRIQPYQCSSLQSIRFRWNECLEFEGYQAKEKNRRNHSGPPHHHTTYHSTPYDDAPPSPRGSVGGSNM
jgi:Heterokaryon incompatibility protein (HET)